MAVRAQPSFSDTYFFGDSLTDTGNLLGVVPSEVTDPPYWRGRISNGPVWADYLADDLGLDATAAIRGGTNFAVGGSAAKDLVTQVVVFQLTLLFGDADANALYAIWGGSELRRLPTDPGAVASSVDDVLDALANLGDLGAEQFLVLNLPDLGLIAGLSPEEKTIARQLSREFNAQLEDALRSRLGIGVTLANVFALTEAIVTDPGGFGFSEIEIPCLENSVCSTDPQGPVADGFLLFDELHPTTAAHRLIADHALAALLPEPDLLVGLSAAGIGLGMLFHNRAQPPSRSVHCKASMHRA
jgi:phospholipase/lecithinase/hemolysin